MAFSEPFPALMLAIAVLAVIIDVWADDGRRQCMTAGYRAWWDGLLKVTYSRLMSDAAGWPRWSHVPMAFLALGLAGAGFLAVGALVFTPDPEAVFSHVLNYFAGPSLAVGLAWLAASTGLRSTIIRSPSVPLKVLLVLLLAAGAILMWAALMHMGTWLEWQYKRTATGYGTEWFYAEVYMEYIREPAGRLISLTAALIVGLPAAPTVLRVLFLTGAKFLGPVLALLLGPLIGGIAATRRGVLGVLAILAALLAGAIGA